MRSTGGAHGRRHVGALHQIGAVHDTARPSRIRPSTIALRAAGRSNTATDAPAAARVLTVLTAQAAEPAGDDGDVAVEAKAIGEGVGVGQEEGLPPRGLQKTPESWRKTRGSGVSRS